MSPEKATLTSTVVHKKTLLHNLLSASTYGPWAKLKPVYLEIILTRDDSNGEDSFIVRVTKLPSKEVFPTNYLGVPIIYLELPLPN